SVQVQDIFGNPLAQVFYTQAGDPLLGDWVANSFDASSFIGQTVHIAFIVDAGQSTLGVHLDNVSVEAGYNSPSTFDVYFGTNPNPGPAELWGSTTNTSWSLPVLAPLTTYYWKIVSRKLGTTPGPAWSFTTRGVDHF